MYMVVYRMAGDGCEMSQFRTWYRRRPAERHARRLVDREQFPPDQVRVEKISFWMKSAFYPTVFLWGASLVVAVMCLCLVVRVAVLLYYT